jgi:putative transposase
MEAKRRFTQEQMSAWLQGRGVMQRLPAWFDHYNRIHPHKALGYRSPVEFIHATLRT